MSQLDKNIGIAAIILAGIVLMPSFVFAETPALPSECPGTIVDYNVVDIANGGETTGNNDFIFAGNNNAIVINGGGGSDCILIGDGNTANISGAGNSDIIIVGNTNSGEIKGKGGNDTIIVGENNTGNISGEGGNDTLVDGYGSTGVINGGGGTDTIVHVPPAPSANPTAGTYTSIQNISLSSSGASSIRYTTNGTTTNCSSGTSYTTPIVVNKTTTITAVGCESGYASPVASLTYTIELKTDSSDLSSVLEAVFVPASGASLSLTPSLTVSQDLEINTTTSGSKIVLSETTVISRADAQEFDAAALTSSNTDVGSLSGLTDGQVFEAALQWGIPNVTLQFNPAITISIFVGTDLNGQTLNVVRSVNGTESWTNEGIVSPGTCVVANGICSFQATKASYYAATGNMSSGSSSSSGGSCLNCIVEIDGVPVSHNTDTAQENVVEEIIEPEITPTPSITPTPTPVVKKVALAKPIVKASPQPVQTEDKKAETVSITEVAQVKENRSFIVSLFASIGRLMFRSLPLF